MKEVLFFWGLSPASPLGVLVILLALGVLVLRVTLLVRLSPGPARWISEMAVFGGVLLLVLTAFQPELHHRRSEGTKPVLHVIWDDSDSMSVEDVDTGSNVLSRMSWTSEFLSSPAFQNLAEHYELREQRLGHEETGVRQTDLAAALIEAGEAEELDSILLVSDGGHNADRPLLPEAIKLQQRGVNLHALAPGQEVPLPDLVLDPVEMPAYALAHEPLTFPVRVRSSLPREAAVELRLEAGHRVLVRRSIRMAPGEAYEGSLQWIPMEPGFPELSVSISPHPDERFPENNRQEIELEVREVRLKVLLVDGQPRWEFRYLRNALMRDPGVEVDCLLLHPELGPARGERYLPAFPADMEALSHYDVVFLGDVGPGPEGLSPTQLKRLEQLVRLQGSGLVFLPGREGKHVRLLETGLQDALPVEYDHAYPRGHGFDDEMQVWLTSEGRKHLLTKLHASPVRNHAIWKQLPGFHWYAPVLRSRVGSEVLATHATRRNRFGRLPMLVVRDVGAGKTLFLGTDSAWRWRWGLEDVYHYRFWGQVVRWMAHKRHMFEQDLARVFLDPERPEIGSPTRIALTLLTAQAAEEIKGVGPRLRFISERGEVLEPALRAASADGSSWEGEWTPQTAGELRMQVLGNNEQIFLDTNLRVGEANREVVGNPLDLRLLRELSRALGGRTAGHRDAIDLVESLKVLPRERDSFERTRLWQHPLWISALVACFATGWIVRKRQGWI